MTVLTAAENTCSTREETRGTVRVHEGWGQPCEVHCDEFGAPCELVFRSRLHRVTAPPQRWYERRRWWELEERVPRESGESVVDRQHWRVQAAQRGAVEPRTLELVRHEITGQWWLLADQAV